ncbi:UNVERIFIED_CONTAM: hypothetical protein K2H54_025961 [Gekko kuhli]
MPTTDKHFICERTETTYPQSGLHIISAFKIIFKKFATWSCPACDLPEVFWLINGHWEQGVSQERLEPDRARQFFFLLQFCNLNIYTHETFDSMFLLFCTLPGG